MPRVFIAVDLPQEIRGVLKHLQQELRPLTNTARWVAPESIHITLKFIGEVSEARIVEIDSALKGLEGEPFQVKLCGVGFFPATRSPRVFWAGLEGAPLPRLAENVETRMAGIEFEREKRPFQPHVTLARARDVRIDSLLVSAAAKYSAQIFGTFTVEQVFLVRSTLKPSGAIYNKLKEYPLANQ